MEAKDTVTLIPSHGWDEACPHCGEEFGIESLLNSVKLEQAEITWDIAFKAGQRKVIVSVNTRLATKGNRKFFNWWQEFLKPEGIELDG